MPKIADVARQAVERRLPGFPAAPRFCLGFAFEAVARAFGTNRWVLYDRILDRTGADLDRSRWAVDAERGISRLRWEVSPQDLDPRDPAQLKRLLALLKPGDLLFSSREFDESPKSPRTAPDREGHVGIYVGDGLVAENTAADRGQWFVRRSALRLTPLRDWDTVTTVGRIPDGWRP